ncbi:hypothetical protein [Acidiphilium acidophilum]|uniref:hypothetical protein n=1 Tax=Acidiphilium acidophilum TaxID=76588 RepID=UPI002E8E643B|nr:hypothetical protein [Acidiphilium acidophilum]
MADYSTRFSCRLDTGSTGNAARAVRLFAAYERLMARHGDIVCFEVESDPMEVSPGGVWIHDGDGMGDPDHVINYVLACAKRFKLRGRWGLAGVMIAPGRSWTPLAEVPASSISAPARSSAIFTAATGSTR